MGEKVVGFFTIIGAIATVFGAVSTYKAVSASSEELSSKGINRIREAAANIVAPTDFTVKSALISKVPDDMDFSSMPNKPILITNKEIPFMITDSSTDRYVRMKVNGVSYRSYLGDKHALKNGSQCSLWLYAIKDKAYSFKMDC